MIAARTHRERCLQHIFYCCVMSQRTRCVPLLRVYGPLSSNGCFSAPTVPASSKYATIYCTVQDLRFSPVLWNVTPCSLLRCYWHFERNCKKVTPPPWTRKQQAFPIRMGLSTRLNRVTSQKTAIVMCRYTHVRVYSTLHAALSHPNMAAMNWVLREHQSQSHFATDGQTVCFGVEHHVRLMIRFSLLLDRYRFVVVGRLRWREDLF
jgi:hypothetical protein